MIAQSAYEDFNKLKCFELFSGISCNLILISKLCEKVTWKNSMDDYDALNKTT